MKTWIKKWEDIESNNDEVLTKEEVIMYSRILAAKEEEFKLKEKKIAEEMYKGLIEEKD